MVYEFLVSGNSDKIAYISLTLRNCVNSIGLALVETLNGLENTVENRAMLSFGTPFILQAWLYGCPNLPIEPISRPLSWQWWVIPFLYTSLSEWMA